ncbi:MAG: cobalamin-dependent protein [Coriobacteriales bacterium]|jgi:methylmalonyl-CoA mutase cobalamin-binding domain/chain|nr:cobalamin-dependent protein [Coriobacteriales bacterium]
MDDILAKISEAVYEGEEEEVVRLVSQALEQGTDPQTIIQEGGVPALSRLGEDFNNEEVFLPELMLGGDCMKALVGLVSPHLGSDQGAYKGKVVIGTAQGDLHDIGKSLVATQLSIHGYEVIDLGTDVPTNVFLDRAEEEGADIIAVSSLLTTAQYYMGDLIGRLNSEGRRNRFRVVVGGGPVGPDYAREVGADGYARTAHLAVKMLDQVMQNEPGTALVIEA